jgi:hypothetical protein
MRGAMLALGHGLSECRERLGVGWRQVTTVESLKLGRRVVFKEFGGARGAARAERDAQGALAARVEQVHEVAESRCAVLHCRREPAHQTIECALVCEWVDCIVSVSTSPR